MPPSCLPHLSKSRCRRSARQRSCSTCAISLGAGRTIARADAQRQGICFALELGNDLPPVRVDSVQIEHVISNLLRNATEAMIATPSSGSQPLEISLRTRADQGGVEFAISDCGPGLSPQIAAHLFEPFQSTKPHGMGLGLAISRGIIETHGGRLWATPNSERGMTFRFTIPMEGSQHE